MSREVVIADRAYAVEADIKRTVVAIRTGWVILAERLFTFYEDAMWEALGYERLTEWLASADVDLSWRMFHYLVSTWRLLVVERGIEPEQLQQVEPSRWQEVLPAIRRGTVTVEKAMADAATLARTDLRALYSGEDSKATTNGKAPDLDKPYPGGKMARCPTCSSMVEEAVLRS